MTGAGDRKPTLLITGATSSLGLPLVARFRKHPQWNLRAMAHAHAAGLDGDAVVWADLRDPEQVRQAVAGVDAVLHLAARTHAHDENAYFEINVKGTRNLLKACEDSGVRRFIHVSSRTAHPQGGAYAVSKLESENAVRHSKLDWLILRPAEIYGGKSNDAINRLAGWIQRLPIVPIIGDGRYTLRPIYIDDVVEELAAVIERPDLKGLVLQMAGPEELTFHEVVDRISTFVGKRPRKVHVPVPLIRAAIALIAVGTNRFLTPDQVPRLICPKEGGDDVSAFLEGIKPRPLEAGLI